MTAAARAELRRLRERWRAIADTYDVNAEEWRRRSTPEEPHAVAVAERTMAALIYRACATDAAALEEAMDAAVRVVQEEARRYAAEGHGSRSRRMLAVANEIRALSDEQRCREHGVPYPHCVKCRRALSVAPATRLTESDKK